MKRGKEKTVRLSMGKNPASQTNVLIVDLTKPVARIPSHMLLCDLVVEKLQVFILVVND